MTIKYFYEILNSYTFGPLILILITHARYIYYIIIITQHNIARGNKSARRQLIGRKVLELR